jgi:uncharacterized membrane protein YeaQ/YmgE (transglycosylase-associated protein family)
MITFVGLFLGQLFAVLVQAALWVNDTRGWGDYFKGRRHQAQHVVDIVASLMLFIAWGTGLLAQFAGLLPDPLPKWIEKLPSTPSGALVTCVIGFVGCFFTRWARQKWFNAPPAPPGD